MKNIKPIRSLSGRKISDIKLFIFAAALVLSLTSCSKEEINEDLQVKSAIQNDASALSKKSAATSGTTIKTITFTAIARIDHCHGEDIQFSGEIENRTSTTIDARGVIHYTRSFNTRGMTGTGTETGTIYDVLGGAEMFAIKDAVFIDGALDLPLSIAESDLVIHQGTLVFKSRTDGSKVVARHIIQKIPGQAETVNKWVCGGK